MVKNPKTKSPYTKLVHVGVIVRDMDKTIKRLQEMGMGSFELHAPPTPSIGQPTFKGKFCTSEEKILEVKMGDVGLVLFEPVKGSSPFQEFLDTKGEGFQHIALAVDDLDGEMSELSQKGIDSLGGLKWEGGGGGFFYDLEIGDVMLEVYKD